MIFTIERQKPDPKISEKEQAVVALVAALPCQLKKMPDYLQRWVFTDEQFGEFIGIMRAGFCGCDATPDEAAAVARRVIGADKMVRAFINLPPVKNGPLLAAMVIRDYYRREIDEPIPEELTFWGI
jgi:hypothetical protein